LLSAFGSELAELASTKISSHFKFPSYK